MQFEKISNKLINSTLKIDCILKDKTVTNGTGFFWRLAEDETGYLDVIVTNRHLVENAQTGIFYIPVLDNGKETQLDIKLSDFKGKWTGHPNEDVDLCILPLG